jgi:hypothetical protein
MEDIPVLNEELLGILNEYVELFRAPDFEKYMHLSCAHDKDQRDWYVGPKYRDEIVAKGSRHDGFPDSIYGYEVSVHREGHEFYTRKAPSIYRRDTTSQLANLNNQIMSWLGTRHTALTACYPPGGFIAWHNNANAAAYNLIFTWSETGEGCFKYIDPVTKEEVVMKDHEGWQCKAAYFGHYGEPESLFYHAAETDCWRITLSFTFNTDDASVDFREEVIEDIKTP